MHVETSAVSSLRSMTLPPVGWAGSAWLEHKGRERRDPCFHASYLEMSLRVKVMLGVNLSHSFAFGFC